MHVCSHYLVLVLVYFLLFGHQRTYICLNHGLVCNWSYQLLSNLHRDRVTVEVVGHQVRLYFDLRMLNEVMRLGDV